MSWRLFSRAERHYARAVALANLGRTDEARGELKPLDAAAAGFTDEWKCGNNLAAEVIAVARKMAEGEIAYREGRKDEAFRLLREAVTLEEQLKYDEPPGWMQPVRHWRWGRCCSTPPAAAEAEEVYRADLKRHPKNAWSLLGLQQAREGQGNADAQVFSRTK